jgi:hypothetical protein
MPTCQEGAKHTTTTQKPQQKQKTTAQKQKGQNVKARQVKTDAAAPAEWVFFDKSDPWAELIPRLTPRQNYFGI